MLELPSCACGDKANILRQNKCFLFLNQTRSQARHCDKRKKEIGKSCNTDKKPEVFLVYFSEKGLVEKSDCTSGGKNAWAFFACL